MYRFPLNSRAVGTGIETTTQKSFVIAMLALCGCILGLASKGFAALGGDVSSVAVDQAHLRATLHSTQKVGYAVHELRAETGIVVHEFSTPEGKIFAVAWEGPILPDLRQLLGSHFDDFQRAAEMRNRKGVRGPLFIQQNGLTVELGGHMRSYRGKAYLSNEMPGSLKAEELR